MATIIEKWIQRKIEMKDYGTLGCLFCNNNACNNCFLQDVCCKEIAASHRNIGMYISSKPVEEKECRFTTLIKSMPTEEFASLMTTIWCTRADCNNCKFYDKEGITCDTTVDMILEYILEEIDIK